MRVSYDPEVDALYIELKDGATATEGVKVEGGTTLHYDAQGNLVALSVLDACQHLGSESLQRVMVDLPQLQDIAP